MSSLIASNLRTNMCLVSLYCTHYLCVPPFPTYTTYTTITKTACSIFFSYNYSVFCLQRRSSNHNRFFTQGWLNSYYWLPAQSCRIIVQHEQYNERSWSRYFAFSRTLSRPLVYVHSHTCLSHLPSYLFLLVYKNRVWWI